MTVAGIMSGTSADGIDVALVKSQRREISRDIPRLRLLAHVAVPYPAAVRKRILQMMNADAAPWQICLGSIGGLDSCMRMR